MKPQNHYDQAFTILVVDDDDVDALGIHRALKKFSLNNTMIRAHDGIEALDLLRQPGIVARPYIILLDINMPRMNGLEMLNILRNDTELSNSLVFIITTSNFAEDKLAAYKHHISGYIVKNQVCEGLARIIPMLEHYWHLISPPLAS